MAETQASIGYGTRLLVGNGGSPTETFADLGVEITSLTPPGYTRDAPDASHMSSPDQYREFIAGMMDAGSVEIEMNWTPVEDDPVIAALEAGKQNYRIQNSEWPVTLTFSAICTAYSPSAPFDDTMTATASFKVSGKPALEAA